MFPRNFRGNYLGSNDDQTRPRQRRGRGGTGSNMVRMIAYLCWRPRWRLNRRAMRHRGGLNQQMMEMLQRMYPNEVFPFNRSGNGINAWINRMMYSALDKGHPTFTDFPTDKQNLWFRQFAQEFNWNSDDTLFIYHHFVNKVMDNYGKQIHEWKKKWEINK
uniref:Uncharacterized protein n=1 Tax=Brassica oleracea var. oleracea TaxID=109376 RepID=A0A0D3BZI5_BRAOL